MPWFLDYLGYCFALSKKYHCPSFSAAQFYKLFLKCLASKMHFFVIFFSPMEWRIEGTRCVWYIPFFSCPLMNFLFRCLYVQVLSIWMFFPAWTVPRCRIRLLFFGLHYWTTLRVDLMISAKWKFWSWEDPQHTPISLGPCKRSFVHKYSGGYCDYE